MDETETAAPAASPAIEEQPAPVIIDDSDGPLTQLHPNHKKELRVQAALTALPFVIGALVSEATGTLPMGAISGPVVLIAAALIWFMPHRRFIARGYAMSDDRLRVVKGLMFRSDTVVPFGRVQHIDVDRGPLERFFDLATLTVHTAGSHNASVHLAGLQHDTALAMREEIRAHIKREAL